MELLPAIVGLAVIDSVNPSALLAISFVVGVGSTLGLGLTPQTVIESGAAYLVLGGVAHG